MTKDSRRNHLFIKKSQIPGAGKGLFTRRDIAKGEKIVAYEGYLRRWKDVKDQDGYNAYLLKLDERWALDARPLTKTLGRYANDAAGARRVKGLRNNAQYFTYGKRCFIEATRKIHAGNEILVSYGNAYWALMRRIHGTQKKG